MECLVERILQRVTLMCSWLEHGAKVIDGEIFCVMSPTPPHHLLFAKTLTLAFGTDLFSPHVGNHLLHPHHPSVFTV
ncbi:hypothetical protein DMENIID0001_129120 [Sergentomyia squamirostris]